MNPDTITRVWTWQHTRAGRYTANGWSVYERPTGERGWFASKSGERLLRLGPCLTREAAMDAAMEAGA